MADAWTDERIERLRTLFADGRSAGQICAELGAGISRNAVVGKLHRLGLRREDAKGVSAAHAVRASAQRQAARERERARDAEELARRAREAQTEKKRLAAAGELAAREVAASLEQIPGKSSQLPESEPATLVTLDTSRRCRWPITGAGTDRPHITGADTLFCGALRGPDANYCPTHRAMSGQKTRTPNELARALQAAERVARRAR